MVAPFISTIQGTQVRPTYFRDLLPQQNDTRRLVPQIIGNDSDGFVLLCKMLSDAGYKSVNWNLGCPSPLITRKRRGSGLLPHAEIIESFLDQTVPRLSVCLSIKARLGFKNPTELQKIIPILNNYPLRELIIHPRTGNQMYSGTVDLDHFEQCSRLCRHKLIYNGDIGSKADMQILSKRFPDLHGYMVGRGILRYPYLLELFRKGTTDESTDRIKAFHDELFFANQNVLAPPNLLGKMKELWKFMGQGFHEGEHFTAKILRADKIETYNHYICDFFSKCSREKSHDILSDFYFPCE